MNKKIILIKSFVSAMIIMCYSCVANKDYSIQKKRTNNNEITIYGTVKEAETGSPLLLIMVFDQKRTQKVQTDKNGKYKMLLGGGRHRLIASWPGFYNVKTRNINFKRGDSVQVNFSMRDDDRPTIN